MSEIHDSGYDMRHDFLYLTAVCLLVALVLFALGAVLASWTFAGISVRDRLELISGQVSNLFTATLVLAAVIALFHVAPERAPRFRAVTVAALMVGVVFAALALYSVGDVLTRHVSSDSQGSISFGLSQGATLRARLGVALPQVGALLLALLAMFGANRIGNFVSGSRVISDDPQDLWEDG